MKRIFLALFSVVFAGAAAAQSNVGPLELDSTYPPTTQNGRISVDVQQDDHATCYVSYFNKATRQLSPIIVGGISNISAGGVFSIAKYNPDLTPDATFGTNGSSTPFSGGTQYPNDLLLLPDGKIIAAGYSDPTHNGNGQTTFFAVTTNGSADPNFGTRGTLRLSPVGTFTTIDTMMRIPRTGPAYFVGMGYFAGQSVIASRIDATGQLDSTFGAYGIAGLGAPVAAARGYVFLDDSVTHEQHIMFVGISNDATPEILLGRFKQNGIVDSTFGTNGLLHTGLKLQGGSWFTSKAYHIEYDSSNGTPKFYDNKIIVAAPLKPKTGKLSVSLIRFNADGTVDTAYGSPTNAKGILTDPILADMDTVTSIALSNDGSLLVSGSQNGYGTVAKFFYVGALDHSFGTNGIAQLSNGFGTQHYSLLGFIPLGGNVGNKIFAGVGTIDGGSSKQDFLMARFVPAQPLKIVPQTLTFGLVDSGKSRDMSFTITNFDNVSHTIDSVAVVNPEFAVVPPIHNVMLAPGASQTVTVRYTPRTMDTIMAVATIFDKTGNRNISLVGRGVSTSAGVAIESTAMLSIVPNPASTFVSVIGASIKRYQIIDALGRSVEVNDRETSNIDVSKVPPGMYFLDLETNNEHSFQKLSIKR